MQQRSTYSTAREIVKADGFGLKGLNKGLTSTLGRHGVFNMIYFGFYHNVKNFFPESKVRWSMFWRCFYFWFHICGPSMIYILLMRNFLWGFNFYWVHDLLQIHTNAFSWSVEKGKQELYIYRWTIVNVLYFKFFIILPLTLFRIRHLSLWGSFW